MRHASHAARSARSGSVLARVLIGLVLVVGIVVLTWIATSPKTERAPENEPALDVRHLASVADAAAAIDAEDAAVTAAAQSGRNALPAQNSAQSSFHTVVVTTRVSLMPDAVIVPKIAVEAGVGSPRDPSVRALAHGITDDRGRATLELDWNSIDAARALLDSVLWVRVAAAGYQQRTTTRKLPVEPGSTDIVLIAYAGTTLRGRLFDAHDTPIAGKVSAKPWTRMGELGFGAMSDAGPDGWFELTPFRPGKYQLVADAGEHGTAALEDVPIPSPTVVELHARGPGVVRGHVRDSKGNAVAALDVLVFLAELDDERGSFVTPEPRGSQVEIEGRGRAWVTLQTDAQGGFEARGLRQDKYVVRARTSEASGYPRLLTPTPVAADGSSLDLVLDHPHVLVHVIRGDGKPDVDAVIPDAKHRFGAPPEGPSDRWPEKTTVVLLPTRATAHLAEEFGRHVEGRPIGGGSFVFDVEDAREYRAGLIGGGNVWHPVDVDVPEGSGLTEVTLTSSAEDARGTLAVTTVDDNGSVLRNNIAIRIEDADEGAPLVVDDLGRDASSPKYFRLPEGRYRVAVEGRSWVEHFHGTLMEPRSFGRFESEVRIVRDRTTDVRATLPKGARIYLHVLGEVLEADRQAVLAANPGATFGGPIDFWAGRAEVWMHEDGHWPQPVHFTYELTGSSSAGTHLGAWLPIGTQQESQLVPSGRFRLEARMPGGRTASTDLVLVDAETAPVTLSFP